MSKLFGLNKPNTNLRKNVFDLSEKRLFSSSAGMLLPCMVKECNPGEKFQIDLSAMTRTQPLNTSAFVRSRQYYHFFFVPFKQLWNGWDNFINGVDYRTSSLQPQASKYNSVPSMSFTDYITRMIKDKRLCGLPQDIKPSSNKPSSTTPYPNRSPQSNPDYNRTIRSIIDGFAPSNLSEYKKTAFDEHGYLYSFGVSRLFDLLGYGFNYKGYQTLSDYLNKVHPANNPASAVSFSTNQRFNMFRFLAYQKIYNDFYKRDDYEATNPLAWNIDDLYPGGTSFDTLGTDRLLEMTRLRYRWMPKDYFTGVVPSELYGLENALSSLGSVSSGVDTSHFEIYSGNSGVHPLGFTDDVRELSTKSIRTAFAVEKLMRLTRRAGGFDYISQTAAHYGFEPPKGRGDKVEFIGGFTNNIDISEVITQSSFAGQVDGSPFGNGVGQIFGKGIGISSNNKEIEFTAKEHGLIMCITSTVPDLDYSSEGIDRFNTKYQRGDYFHPEFQDLGLQPVFGYELRNDLEKGNSNSLIGFNPMYSEYKTSYDKLHGEFRNGRTMSAWSAGSLLGMVSGSGSSTGIDISTLKINPKCLDRIFSIDFNGMEYSDQFISSVQFIVKAIRPMSVTGQNL